MTRVAVDLRRVAARAKLFYAAQVFRDGAAEVYVAGTKEGCLREYQKMRQNLGSGLRAVRAGPGKPGEARDALVARVLKEMAVPAAARAAVIVREGA